MYCSVNEASGSVKMRTNSSAPKSFNSTRIGKRPCSSGIRSEGLLRWKAPEAINKIWSVFNMPYLVETVLPSTKGRRSRCTPARDTSLPPLPPSLRCVILSISSKKTMPSCSTESITCAFKSSSLISLLASSSASARIALATVNLRVAVLDEPIFWNISCN